MGKGGDNGQKASVTVYFSLVCILVFAVLFTTIESARMTGIRFRCRSSVCLGLESMFADYSIPLLQKYGILGLDSAYGTDNPQAYQVYLREYVENNANPNHGLWITGMDFYPVKLVEVKTVRSVAATGYAGYAMEDAVLKNVEDTFWLEIVERVLGEMDFFTQSNKMSEFFSKLSPLQDAVTKVDTAIQAMHHSMQTLKEVRVNLESQISGIEQVIEELREGYGNLENADSEEEAERCQRGIEMLEDSVRKQMEEILQEQGFLYAHTNQALKNREIYRAYTPVVHEGLMAAKQELEMEGFYEDRDIMEIMDRQLEEIDYYAGGMSDHYLVEEKGSVLEKNAAILQDNIRRLEHISMDDVGSVLPVLKDCLSNMADYQQENLTLNYDSDRVQEKRENVLEQIKKIKNQGLLGIVMSDKEISDKEFSKNEAEISRLPSQSCKEDMEWKPSEDFNSEDTVWDETVQKILVNEYALERFSNSVSLGNEGVLSYEVEYLLGGKGKDRENLEVVVNRLLAVREGMNLIALMKDSVSGAQAEALAVMLVGYSGMYGLIKVTQMLLLAAWAFAEAIADVKTLLHEGKVALLKEVSQFQVSFAGFEKVGKMEFVTESKKESGLTYQDYLRLLLMGERREWRTYRMMDLIQENIRMGGQSSFFMENCLLAIEVSAEFEAKAIFTQFPFVNRGDKNRDEKRNVYTITGNSVYGY